MITWLLEDNIRKWLKQIRPKSQTKIAKKEFHL